MVFTSDGPWALPIQDLEVVALEIWLAWADLIVGSHPDRRCTIRLGGPLTLTDPGGASHRCGPIEDSWVGLAPLLSLRGVRVRSADADVRGTLTLEFSDGRQLEASARSEAEAWHVIGDDFQLVCAPGGQVHVWGSPDAQ